MPLFSYVCGVHHVFVLGPLHATLSPQESINEKTNEGMITNPTRLVITTPIESGS